MYRYGKIELKNHPPLFTRRALVFGTADESMRIGRLLQDTPESHFILIGYVDRDNFSLTSKFLGRMEDIDQIINKKYINEIIIPENFMQIRDLILLLNKFE